MKKIKMSESAYITVGDLANVHRAQDALRAITVGNSAKYIPPEEYETVMTTLYRWSNKIFDLIEAVDDEPEANG